MKSHKESNLLSTAIIDCVYVSHVTDFCCKVSNQFPCRSNVKVELCNGIEYGVPVPPRLELVDL
jgi:hypothetical protein